MMKETSALLIFPTQLFKDHELLKSVDTVVLIEAPLYFTEFIYHKKKLILHRASMKAYQKYLDKKSFSTHYIEYSEYKKISTVLKKFDALHYFDPIDVPLQKELNSLFKKLKAKPQQHESPSFISSIEYLEKYLKRKKGYYLYSFYIQQRKHFNILLTKNKKPVGGSWSFDKENRKPLPANIKIPKIVSARLNTYGKEALHYIKKQFSKNPATVENTFEYPVTHTQAESWLDRFLKKRFKNFGPYQDAIRAREHYLFHSVLSPLLNTGLLTPDYVLEKALDYAKKRSIPINSLEGFIRQLVGWREFVRGVYHFDQKKERTTNFFKFKRSLPACFWDGSTGIEPIDITIKKVLASGYAHHIERLMILGNFMLLCQCNPDSIYEWFMEFFIDAYDWVMVPNVYSMSQYADGGLMTTKPYISSSNYVLSMSDYATGEWEIIWDGLYWHFLYAHKKLLSKNPRMRFMYAHLKKMKKQTLEQHIQQAHTYLKSIDIPCLHCKK